MGKFKAEVTSHWLINKKVGTLNIGKSYYSLPLDLYLQTFSYLRVVEPLWLHLSQSVHPPQIFEFMLT